MAVGLRREALARRRRALGLSQEHLADALRVDRKTVARWESGESEPHPAIRTDLARKLRLTLEELDQILGVSRSADARGEAGDQPDPAEVAAAFDALDLGYSTTPAVLLLAPASSGLQHIEARRALARSRREAKELDALEARARLLLGQLLWDAAQRRSHEAADLQFSAAADLARRCHDPALEGRALLRHTYLALYGQNDPHAGLRLTARAADLARYASPAILALAELHAGEAHAMLGDKAASHRSLRAAEHELARIDEFDPAFDLYSPSVGSRLVGSSLIRLRDYSGALSALDEATALASPGSKSQALVLANAALALARSGRADAAAARLTEAIVMIEATRGGGALNIAFQAGRELHRSHPSPATSEVIDRLMALVAG